MHVPSSETGWLSQGASASGSSEEGASSSTGLYAPLVRQSCNKSLQHSVYATLLNLLKRPFSQHIVQKYKNKTFLHVNLSTKQRICFFFGTAKIIE